jgi:hypothetical protein
MVHHRPVFRCVLALLALLFTGACSATGPEPFETTYSAIGYEIR